MKKVAIILTAAVTTALLSSCAKTYTCECTDVTNVTDSNGVKSTVTEKYSFTYKAKKKYSDEACNNFVDAKAKPSSTTFSNGAESVDGSIQCTSK